MQFAMVPRRHYPEEAYPIKEERIYFMKKYQTFFHASGPMRVFWKWHIVSSTFMFAMMVYRILEVWRDLVRFTAILAEIMIVVQTVWKTTTFVYYAPGMRKMHEDIDLRFWGYDICGKKPQKTVHKYFKWMSWLVWGQYTCGIVTIVGYQMFPVDVFPPERRQLTAPLKIPFDVNPSPIHEIVWVYVAISQEIWVVAIAMFDMSISYFWIHLIVQLELLKDQLESLTEGIVVAGDFAKLRSKEFQEEVFRRLVVCMKHHKLLLVFGSNLGDYSSISFGLQLLGSLLSIVLGGFQLSQKNADFTNPDTLKQIQYTSVLSFQLIIFAVYGSILEFKSEELAQAAYHCEWYLCEPRIRKALVLLQMNARKEITMKAAGLAQLNNNTWLSVCRAAFSCITVLHSIDTINENTKA